MPRNASAARDPHTFVTQGEGGREAGFSGAPEYKQRQIVSYYAFTTIGKSPLIHEIRQVLTVDKETLAKDFEGHKLLEMPSSPMTTTQSNGSSVSSATKD